MFLAVTPLLVIRFNLRSLFCAGVVAWALRYGLLTVGSGFELAWPVFAAILMNGPCFVFIFVVGVMYVDRSVGGAHRGAAQGMFAIATAGIANLFGALLVALTQGRYLTPEGVYPPPYSWTPFWAVPAFVCVAAVVLAIVWIGTNRLNKPST
jgi:Nucleoside H+ symporter